VRIVVQTIDKNADIGDDLVLRSEAARILGVAPTTVTRWAREGRLACRVTLGGHHRFERSVLEEVRASMEHGGGVRLATGARER
jgi:excisionase family DNA binding protein